MSVLNLLRNIPFLRFSFALGGGIFLAEYFERENFIFFLICFFVTSFFLFYVLLNSCIYQNYKNRWFTGFLFFIFLVNLGIILNLSSRSTKLHEHYPLEAKARVLESDLTLSGYFCFTVAPLKVISEKKVPVGRKDRWLIYMNSEDSLLVLPAKPGNIVVFQTDLCCHSNPGNPDSFDFGKYLFRQGISGTGFVHQEHFRVLKHSGFNGLAGRIKNMRMQAFQIYKDYGIKGDELQVLAALTLGMRQELDNDVKSWFVHTGAIHVLAVSGLHVGIIFVLLNWLLDTLFFPKRSLFRMILVISVLIFYTLLTGTSPSVVRAVVMFSVIQLGNYIRRSGNIYNLLGVSAFILFLIQPMCLFNVGFWLSHLAVAGIVTLYPVFHRFYAGKNLFIRKIGNLVSVSLSAQIGTFPLSLFVFRAFPLWFLLANFFILPLVVPVLVLGNFLILFGKVPGLAIVFAGALVDLLKLMIEFAMWLNSFPFSYIQGLWLGEGTMLLLYILISAALLWHHFKIKLFFKASLLACFLIVLIQDLEYLLKRNTDAFVVFDAGRKALVGKIEKGKGFLYVDKEMTQRQIEFACSGFFFKHAFKIEQCNLFEKPDVRIFPVDDGCYLGIGDVNLDGLIPNTKACDQIRGVVFLGDTKGDVIGFMKRIGCSRIILSGACPSWCVKRWIDETRKEDWMIYDVAQNGAFISSVR
jgi:competence protein ComEC